MLNNRLVPLALLAVLAASPAAHAQFGALKNMKDKLVKKDAPTDAPASAGTAAVAAGPVSKGSVVPTWTMKFKQAIAWQKLTPAGVFVVSCSDALYGIDPQTGAEKWKIVDFNGLKQENFDLIPGSPFVAVVDKVGGKGMGKLGTKFVILDAYTGKAVVNTKELGLLNASKRAFVPETGSFLLFGQAEVGGMLIATDASTGAEKWRTPIVSKTKVPETAISQPYLVDSNKAFLWATNLALYKLDAASGRVIWRTASLTADDAAKVGAAVATAAAGPESAGSKLLGMSPLGGFKGMGSAFGALSGTAALDAGASARATYSSINYLEAPQSPGKIFVFSNDYLTAFDIATGKEIWEREPLKSPISNIIYNERGLIVATSEFDDDAKRNGKLKGGLSRINLYNYATGARTWGKDGVETDGTVGAYSFAGKDFIVATARASGRNRLDIIDLDRGTSKLKRALTVDGSIKRVMLVPQGLLYVTNQEMNIMNLETGKDDWAKSVKFNKEKGIVTALKGDKCYILSDTKLLALDCKTAEYKLVADNIPFQGKETPTDFELMPDGILLKSSQNLQMLDWNGKPQYSYFTPAPGRSMAGKIFFGTMGVLNAAAGAAAAANAADEGFRAGASGYGTASYNDHMTLSDRSSDLAAGFAGGVGESIRQMNKRFKATKDGTNLVTMLTTIKGDEASGVGIKMVDKRTGKEVTNLVLDSKKPDYILDDIGRMVFFKVASDELYGYQF
ncbi:hypothetical protein GCM10022409_22300 [Hymenobacter glaciei]|uniref:Pyrrolo-quinoline quinone repeat domain-containing protein n=1 Tax=Hymenobacter glaciei TaxID=877209 RepID=A0ABP7U6K0_9BACT